MTTYANLLFGIVYMCLNTEAPERESQEVPASGERSPERRAFEEGRR